MKALCFATMLFLALSTAAQAAPTNVAGTGVITPDVAIGFERVTICSSSPSGELLVSESSMCFSNETFSLSRYVKSKYPTRSYVGFQIAPDNNRRLNVFYR